MVTGSREAAAGRQWRQHAEASAQGESSASVLPCRVCGRVWRKRRRFAFWRNRPPWRRRRALAIGRAHSLYSHPGWLETAHQTAHMCFSVINSTMTPSRHRAQDCPRPLVLPHGCVCPPAFYSVALTRRSGGTTVCLLRAPAARAGLYTAANRGQSAGRLLPRLCPSPPNPHPRCRASGTCKCAIRGGGRAADGRSWLCGLVRSMGGRAGSRRRAALQPPRHRHASGQCARVRRRAHPVVVR